MISCPVPLRCYSVKPTFAVRGREERVFMTSEERREARYQRRKAQRAAKHLSEDNFDEVFTMGHLRSSYKKSRRTIRWKHSTQSYVMAAPIMLYYTYWELTAGRFRSNGFYEFDIFERGKARHIRSVTFRERVVQKCLCDYSLDPIIAGGFIHDNGASRPNKGYHFAVKRLERHLHYHYRKHGTDGYILLFDFKKFFDSVDHAVVKNLILKKYTDQRLIDLIFHFIDCFGDIGMGLGSQISQTLALASANRMDHYVKQELRIKGYGRYMDDGYLIHHDKEYLKRCLRLIKAICEILHINLNEKKTQIVKLTHGFVYLKCRFYLLDTGRIAKKIYKRSITKMRQKLKSLRKMLDAGQIIYEDVRHAYWSWLGYAKHFDAWNTINSIKRLFNELYHEEEYLWKVQHYKGAC